MSSTYYTSLSGMTAASYGLQNTSNNIANMQSPGFKRSDVFYSSLGHSGVTVGGHNTNFSAGNYLETNNASDLAIVGNGFFIVKLKNNELLYTRDGEFGFNHDGMLIDKHSGGLVQGYDKKGALIPIHQYGSKTSPGKATHSIDLKGDFVIVEQEKDPNTPDNPDPFKSKYEHIKFGVVNIFDEKGKAHTVNLEFEAPGMPGSGQNSRDNLEWNLIAATCDDATITFDTQSIKFNFDNDGSAEQGSNTIHFNLNGNQSVAVNFGEYMQDKNASVRLYKKNNADHSPRQTQVGMQIDWGINGHPGIKNL